MCGVQGKQKQVLNFNSFWNDLFWSREWFLKPSYSLNLFETHFRFLLGTFPACNAFNSNIFAFKKFDKFPRYRRVVFELS